MHERGKHTGVDLRCTHISLASLPDGDAPPAEWAALLGLKKEQQQQQQLQQQQQGEQTEQEQDQQGMGSTSFVLLADPSFLKIQVCELCLNLCSA